MASIGDVGGASFDSYEGVRIIVPGLIVYGLGVATFGSLAPDADLGLADNTLASLVASLVVGLFLYYWDFPAKSAAFSQGLPSAWLQDKYPSKSGHAVVTAYLLALNTIMPANVRNRSLYMGSMYRIGLELIMATSVCVTIIASAGLLDVGDAAPGWSDVSRYAFAATLVVAFFLGMLMHLSNEGKNARKGARPKRKLRASARDVVSARIMWLYGLGVLLMCSARVAPVVEFLNLQQFDRLVACVGLGTSYVCWAKRYVFGSRRPDSGPQVLDPLAAGALFIFPIVLGQCLFAAAENSILEARTTIVGWAIAGSIAVILIMLRGHDRKLRGTYHGAIRWLETNETEYAHILPQDEGAASVPHSKSSEKTEGGAFGAPWWFEIRLSGRRRPE